jgi:hypothetical protein
MAQLAQTPGYQFSLQQGELATQNSYAAQGLGSSGAAEKGAASFAEGLAGTTFQQQYSDYMQQNQTVYNMLSGQVGTGLSATQLIANAAQGIGSNISNAQIGAGAASAAGTIGSANALTSGLNSAASGAGNSLSSLAFLYGLNPGNMFNKTPGAPLSSSNPDLVWNPYNAVGTETLGGATANSGSGVLNYLNALVN